MDKINNNEILRIIKNDGFVVIPDFWSDDFCNKARAEIDSIIDNRLGSIISDDFGADNRIFGIEHLSELIREKFYQNSVLLSLFSELYNVEQTCGTVLGQRVEAKPENRGSGGGWHRDSQPNQYKAFLFLSDVTDMSGPFQLYPGTHKLLSKIKSFIKLGWRYGRQLDYDSPEVRKKIIAPTLAEVSLICNAGSLAIVNTSVIHRGKPDIKVNRYSLSYYSYKKEVPEHVLRISEKSKKYAIS